MENSSQAQVMALVPLEHTARRSVSVIDLEANATGFQSESTFCRRSLNHMRMRQLIVSFLPEGHNACSSANGSANKAFAHLINLLSSFAMCSLNYSLVDTVLVFAACEMRNCVSVSIVDYDTLGNVESFDVILE